MGQPQVTNAIVNSQLKLVVQVSRGTFIVPSFDEIWPQAGKDGVRGGKGAKMRMSYITFSMPCSTTDWDIYPSLTTSQPVADSVSRSTSTTTLSRSTPTTLSRT